MPNHDDDSDMADQSINLSQIQGEAMGQLDKYGGTTEKQAPSITKVYLGEIMRYLRGQQRQRKVELDIDPDKTGANAWHLNWELRQLDNQLKITKDLALEIEHMDENLKTARRERDSYLQERQDLVAELGAVKKRNAKLREQRDRLRQECGRLLRSCNRHRDQRDRNMRERDEAMTERDNLKSGMVRLKRTFDALRW